MSKTPRKHRTPLSASEAAELTGLEHSTLIEFIQREWICPADANELDEEDVARARLIQELRLNMGINDEAVPLVLHLVDQLYYLRAQMSRLRSSMR